MADNELLFFAEPVPCSSCGSVSANLGDGYMASMPHANHHQGTQLPFWEKCMRRDELNEALWAMPCSERMAMLVCSVLERDKSNAFISIKRLVGLIGIMARYLSFQNRMVLAESLRDSADQIERQPPCLSPIAL
jgi:hypothetical protein